jgi:GT2 family glycosyltransferase
MKLSWLLLTMNRQDKTKRALEHNMSNAGHAWDELIWVDNGSSDNVREVVSQYNPTVSVLHSTNLGVAKGYNRAKLLSTGDWVLDVQNVCAAKLKLVRPATISRQCLSVDG